MKVVIDLQAMSVPKKAELINALWDDFHGRGYKEDGTTTPFDRCVLNDIDRFHLVQDGIERLPQLGPRAAYAKQAIRGQ